MGDLKRNTTRKLPTILICIIFLLLYSYIFWEPNYYQQSKGEAISSLAVHGREVDWHEITEISGSDNVSQKTKFFVYSAYLDYYENENVLRVISITPSYSTKELFCHVFDKNLKLLEVFPATVRTTKCPQSSLMYSAASILCKLDAVLNITTNKDFLLAMKFVSIYPHSKLSQKVLSNVDKHLSNILRITISTPEDTKEPHKFAICVQPTYTYDKVFEFVQWMEFHKMMGVSHFTFYNTSIGPRLTCIMKSTSVNQVTPVHVLKWTPPITDTSILHMYGQLAQSNDCAFRYRGVSKYLVIVDFDECIIPNYTYARDYEELIEVIDKEWNATGGTNKTVAQYQFRGGFFGSEFGEYPPSTIKTKKKSTQIQLEDLTIYKYVKRPKELMAYKQRSKTITIPRRIIEPGVHSVDEAVGDAIELEIPFQIAYLHHYRDLGCTNSCSTIAQELDFVGHFFSLRLLQNVRNMMAKLMQECDLGDWRE